MAVLKTVLGLLLTALFIFAGSQKFYPYGEHEKLVAGFKKFLDVWQFDQFGLPWAITAEHFRLAVGYGEVVLALALWVPGLRTISNLLLLCIMLAATYTHVKLQEPFVFPLVIAGLLVVHLLLSGGKAATSADAGKKKGGKKSN